jgi:hypothetical protein
MVELFPIFDVTIPDNFTGFVREDIGSTKRGRYMLHVSGKYTGFAVTETSSGVDIYTLPASRLWRGYISKKEFLKQVVSMYKDDPVIGKTVIMAVLGND